MYLLVVASLLMLGCAHHDKAATGTHIEPYDACAPPDGFGVSGTEWSKGFAFNSPPTNCI